MAKLSRRNRPLKDLARRALVLLIAVLAATSAAAALQEKKAAPRPKTRAEFDAYTQLYNEKDMRRKAMLAAKFIADFPQSDFRLAAYQLEIQANEALGNHEKVVSAGKRRCKSFLRPTSSPRYTFFSG